MYDVSEVVAQARMLEDAFRGSRMELTKDVSLRFVQVGNEPNFYCPDAVSYVLHWQSLARATLSNLKMDSEDDPSLWVGSEVIGSGYPFHLVGSLEAGIIELGEIIAATSVLEEHLYFGALQIGAIPGGPPPGTLMNKASIRGNLSSVYDGMLVANSYGKDYYMGETNTYAAYVSQSVFGNAVVDAGQIGKESSVCPTPPNLPYGQSTTC